VCETTCPGGRCQRWASCFQPGQNPRSPLGISGGLLHGLRPTPPGHAGSVGALLPRQGFAPSGPCPRFAAGRASLPGPLCALDPSSVRTACCARLPSIITPGHSSLGPRFTSLSGHRPAMFSGPQVGPPFLLPRLVCETTCPAATAQQFRQASKTPVEAFSRPCRPSGVSEPQKTRCRPAMAV
jgi:hypothetical protein